MKNTSRFGIASILAGAAVTLGITVGPSAMAVADNSQGETGTVALPPGGPSLSTHRTRSLVERTRIHHSAPIPVCRMAYGHRETPHVLGELGSGANTSSKYVWGSLGGGNGGHRWTVSRTTRTVNPFPQSSLIHRY
jgi:hypothetical protein